MIEGAAIECAAPLTLAVAAAAAAATDSVRGG
jgi:hypothetical protein